MNKSLIVNFKELEENDVTINEFLYISFMYLDKDYIDTSIDLEILQKKRLIKIRQLKIGKEIILRQKSLNLIKNSLVDLSTLVYSNKKVKKKSISKVSEEVEKRASEFRDKWKGLKAGARGGLKSCKEKLTRWMEENPEYTFEDILKAADIYLSTEGRNLHYLQRADYFIFKQDRNKEESSRLSAFIDEIEENEVQDWTSKLN